MNQAICITLPYSVVVFMVRDFLSNSSDIGEVDERQVGSRAGALAGAYAFSQVPSACACVPRWCNGLQSHETCYHPVKHVSAMDCNDHFAQGGAPTTFGGWACDR